MCLERKMKTRFIHDYGYRFCLIIFVMSLQKGGLIICVLYLSQSKELIESQPLVH